MKCCLFYTHTQRVREYARVERERDEEGSACYSSALNLIDWKTRVTEISERDERRPRRDGDCFERGEGETGEFFYQRILEAKQQRQRRRRGRR